MHTYLLTRHTIPTYSTRLLHLHPSSSSLLISFSLSYFSFPCSFPHIISDALALVLQYPHLPPHPHLRTPSKFTLGVPRVNVLVAILISFPFLFFVVWKLGRYVAVVAVAVAVFVR